MKAKGSLASSRKKSNPLQSLLAKRDELDRQIARLESEERDGAIARIRLAIEKYGLTVADLMTPARTRTLGAKSSTLLGTKAPVKFRHFSSEESWSDRGSQPRWLRAALKSGRKISDFAV